MRKKRSEKEIKKLIQLTREIQEEKGIIHKKDRSAIMTAREQLILPGIPEYIPTPWTINAFKRVILNLLKEWELKTRYDSEEKREDMIEFSRHCFQVLNEEREKLVNMVKSEKEYVNFLAKNNMDSKIIDTQRSLNLIETFDAIKILVFDSFVVAYITDNFNSVSEFFEWLDNWLNSILNLWRKEERAVK